MNHEIACTSKWHTKTHSSDTFVRFPKWNQQQPQPNNRKKPNNHQSNAWATLILFLMFQCVLINNFFRFCFWYTNNFMNWHCFSIDLVFTFISIFELWSVIFFFYTLDLLAFCFLAQCVIKEKRLFYRHKINICFNFVYILQLLHLIIFFFIL